MSATALIVGGAIGLAQLGYGWWQEHQGRKEQERLDKNKPEVSVPTAVREMRSRAERGYLEGNVMRERREAEIQRGTAGQIRAIREGARSPMDYITGVSEAFTNELDNLNELAREDYMYRTAADERVYTAMGQEGQYEMVGQQARREDWWNKYKVAAGMQEAGVQTMWGGVNTIATSAMQYGTQRMEAKQHADWLSMMKEQYGMTAPADEAARIFNGQTPRGATCF